MSGKNISALRQRQGASQDAPTASAQSQQSLLLNKEVLGHVRKWLSLLELQQMQLAATQAQLNAILEQHAPGWGEGEWQLDAERGVLVRSQTAPAESPEAEPLA